MNKNKSTVHGPQSTGTWTYIKQSTVHGPQTTERWVQLLCIIILLMTCHIYSYGQQNQVIANQIDSLTIEAVIKKVIDTHPSVKEAEETINEANTKINLAKSGYYPNVDATGSYTRLGPASGINFPGLGFFELYPLNNFNASLNVNENIYDFGKTKKNVDYQKENMNLAKESAEQVKQKLSMMTTTTFYNILYLQDAIVIKDEQLKTLQEHLSYIEKKKETGSATQYEILTTKVRISNAESQKVDLDAMLQSQTAVMNMFLGQPEKTMIKVKRELKTLLHEMPHDSLISFAYKNRDEMKLAEEKTTLAQLDYKIKKSASNPAINAFAMGGWKNGFFPNLNVLTANYAAGVGLSVPIFEATRNKSELLIARSEIGIDDYKTEEIRRNITDEVVENEANLNASRQKVDQYTLQLSQAKEALSLAEINFKTGAITNLDLLDATTAVSESKLQLLKSNIDYVVSTYKLKQAIGERLY